MPEPAPGQAAYEVVESPNKPRPEDPLTRSVADMLRRIEANYDREGSGPGSRFEGALLEDVQAQAAVKAVTAALGPCPGCESLRVQCSELAGELGAAKGGNAEYAGRLRQAEHDAIALAADRDNRERDFRLAARERDAARAEIRRLGNLLTTTSMAKCDAMEDRDRFRTALEEIRARGRDGYVIARVLWDVAVSALSDGPGSPHVPDDGEEPTAEDAASLDDLEPLEGHGHD